MTVSYSGCTTLRIGQSRMNYQQAKQQAEHARQLSQELGRKLQAFPRGPLGLVPDHIKFSAPYQELKARYDTAFAQERHANAYLVKHFKTELQQERRERNTGGGEEPTFAPRPRG